ncbi:MAG: hypothetical protein IIB73_04810 [Proteobacteria bacterium]|nr:hypothetical protein [Pseudomonadota bacterium]
MAIQHKKPRDACLACQLIYPLRNSKQTLNYFTSRRLVFGITSGFWHDDGYMTGGLND